MSINIPTQFRPWRNGISGSLFLAYCLISFVVSLFPASDLVVAMSADHWLWVIGKLDDASMQAAYEKENRLIVNYYRQSEGCRIELVSENELSGLPRDTVVVYSGPLSAFTSVERLELPFLLSSDGVLKLHDFDLDNPRTGIYLRNRTKTRILYGGLSYNGWLDLFGVYTGQFDCTVTINATTAFEGDYSGANLVLQPSPFMTRLPTITDLIDYHLPESALDCVSVYSDDAPDKIFNTGFTSELLEGLKGKKVLFVGEMHWNHEIDTLKNRLVSFLAENAGLRGLIVEANASFSGYYDYYVTLRDDAEATAFFNKRIHYMVTTESEAELLELVRSWNLDHPAARIRLGAIDLEWHIWTPIEHVLLPFLRLVDSGLEIKDQDFRDNETYLKLHRKMERLVDIADKRGLVGEAPFITPSYIREVLRNMKVTVLLDNMEKERQQAIVHNLSTLNAGVFKDGLVMCSGGGWHAVKNPLETNDYYRDAQYMQHVFPPTRGKVLSLMIRACGYGFKSIYGLDLDKRLSQATYYDKLTRSFQEAEKQGRASIDEYYMLDKPEFPGRYLIKYGLSHDINVFQVRDIDWTALGPSEDVDIDGAEKKWGLHDLHILILRGQIERTRPASPETTGRLSETLAAGSTVRPTHELGHRRFNKPFAGPDALVR